MIPYSDHKGAVGLVTDRLIDTLTLTGTPSQCRTRIGLYEEAGFDLVNLYPAHQGAMEDRAILVDNAIKTFSKKR